MPLKVNHANNLRRQFLGRQLLTSSKSYNGSLTEKQKSNIKKWVTRYRRNLEIYVEEVFQIKLFPVQKIMVHMMGISDVFFAICSRACGKSFLVALVSLAIFCTRPYSEIVITASTVGQASKMVEKKMRDEIIKKLSPYLLDMLDKEYIVITKGSEDSSYVIRNMLNGSSIIVLAALDSSRGSRATVIIYEECRLLKKAIVDSVFEPMGHNREAKYLTNKKYRTKRWQEKAKSIYITSAKFKYEWFWSKFKETVSNYYTEKHEVYLPFGEDIFAAIDDGTRTWADFRKAKKGMPEMEFNTEILNQMVGEAEDAFFELKEFKENQIIKKAFVPPKSIDILTEKDLGNAVKKDNEIRLIIADFAFANSISRHANDHTIIMLMSLHRKHNKFERHVDYIEGWPGGDSTGAGRRVRQLFWLYRADYLIPDMRNGGEALYNLWTEPLECPELGRYWNPHGLTVLGIKSPYHVVTTAKIEDLISRTVDPIPVPCIIPMQGAGELNSQMWIELKKQLQSNNIKFLLSNESEKEFLEDSGAFYKFTSEEFAEFIAPYLQTDLLIQEAITLKAEYRADRVILTENRGAFKDRIVCLSYGNYIASKIENEWNKNEQEEEFDTSNIQLVW